METLRQTSDRINRGLSSNGLHALHESIGEAVVIDDAAPPNQEVFGVRIFSDFRIQSASIEEELRQRGESFDPIRW